MAIVGGLDLHRKQITFDVLDTVSGQVRRGRISPADRQLFRGSPAGQSGQHVELAVEGCTGWRFVIEECQAAGVVAHLAEPAEVARLLPPQISASPKLGSWVPRNTYRPSSEGRPAFLGLPDIALASLTGARCSYAGDAALSPKLCRDTHGAHGANTHRYKATDARTSETSP